MNIPDFNTEVEYAITHGLSAYTAITFVAFMHKHFESDLRLHTSYYTQWLKRYHDEPLAYMDESSTALYELIETTTSVFVETL